MSPLTIGVEKIAGSSLVIAVLQQTRCGHALEQELYRDARHGPRVVSDAHVIVGPLAYPEGPFLGRLVPGHVIFPSPGTPARRTLESPERLFRTRPSRGA